EPLLGSEYQPAHLRVQPVGSDDQVEVTRVAAVECDTHASAVIVERANAVPEDRIDLAAERAIDDGGQLAACNAHVTATRSAHEQLGIQRGDALSVFADLPDLAEVIPATQDVRRDAHPGGQGEPRPPEVHDVPAAPKFGGSFDERGLVA